MKEGFDKEIDSLLRRRARGGAGSFADGDGALTAAPSHLDADELGAFAEGALPAPARLAAASHLADCDRCRGVVVALSRALGGGAESKQEKAAAVPASAAAKKPAAWRAWAAALFAPRALRFAAPVLALSVVAVVSYVALRTRNADTQGGASTARPNVELAKARPEAGNAATATTANANTAAGTIGQINEKAPEQSDPAAPARQPSEGRGPNAGEPQPAPVVGTGGGGGTGAPASAADAAAPEAPPPAPTPAEPPVIAKAGPRQVAAEEAEQPSKSEGQDKAKSAREADSEVASNDLATQQRSRAAQNRAGEVQMPDGGSRAQKRDGNVSNIYGGNAGAPPPPKEAEREDRALAARRGRSSTRVENKAEVDEVARVGETREAAGHRFRRDGSAWVDVKYKTSMNSTGVRRGTEAFRALVADYPVVGRVAEQIPGVVIIVVGGRSYRIQ